MSIGDWRGWRKLFAFLVVALVVSVKLDGPDLVQAITWTFAAYMGGNVGAAFSKRPTAVVNMVRPSDEEEDTDMTELPRPSAIGFGNTEGEEDGQG
jgi:hypothetical protein